MNKVLLHGKMEEIPVMSFLPDKKQSHSSAVEICQGMFVCKVNGKKEYYPILASGNISVELMEVAKRGMEMDIVGFFKHFCWENDNLERHMSYYLLITDIYYDGKDMSEIISDRNSDVEQMMTEKMLVPINSFQYDNLIKKII